MKHVLVIGSAEQSAGGVSNVIKLHKNMPVWQEFGCYWLGTQIQRNYLWKLWYALRGNIIALVTMWRYDIVHIHTTPDKLGLIIQLPILVWAKIWGRKVLIHLHVGNQLRTKKNPLFTWCLKRADLIILLAKKWQDLFAEWYPEVKTPTTVLYNPCEDSQGEYDNDNGNDNDNDNDNGNEKENLIMMAAWYNDNKAADLLLKALQWLRGQEVSGSKFQDVSGSKFQEEKSSPFKGDGRGSWRVALLGNGEVDRFKQMADEMGLSDIVSFPGYVVGREREEYFRKASIYCMCSYEEGFPMVVLESWMYGISVITTPVGGLPDVLISPDSYENPKPNENPNENPNQNPTPNCNALVFDFGDWQTLAKHLQTLMNDPALRHTLAVNGRQLVTSRFSMEKINDDLREIYKGLKG